MKEELYDQYKGLLLRLAYQLTGSWSDAEDVLQDVFVKVHQLESDRLLEHPKAYLCKMVTNRCLDLLKSARKRRETYVGPWLPEPILTSEQSDFEAVVHGDMLSYAMLVLLERLTPAERAVFVLREALDFEYPVIAELIGKSEGNCRKLLSRSRGKMRLKEEELAGAEAVTEAWIQQFLTALTQGNVDGILSMLDEEAVLISDGGGKVMAALKPISSREHILKFLQGIFRKAQQFDGVSSIDIKEINSQSGVIFRQNGQIQTVVILDINEGVLQHLYFIRNPDKLTHIK